MGEKLFPRCQLCSVPTAALKGSCCPIQITQRRDHTIPVWAERVCGRRGIMSKMNNGCRRRKNGEFVLNEEQWEWVDKDDEEPLSYTCTPGIFLKGYPLRLLCVFKGRDVLASSPGCQAVFLYCQSGRVLQSSEAGNCLGISSAAN